MNLRKSPETRLDVGAHVRQLLLDPRRSWRFSKLHNFFSHSCGSSGVLCRGFVSGFSQNETCFRHGVNAFAPVWRLLSRTGPESAPAVEVAVAGRRRTRLSVLKTGIWSAALRRQAPALLWYCSLTKHDPRYAGVWRCGPQPLQLFLHPSLFAEEVGL